jgi:hypothetical protein
MLLRRTVRTLLACAGWFFAGIFGGAVISIVLCIVMMMLFNSEALGQGILFLFVSMFFIAVGASLGFERATVTWEKRRANGG